MSVGKAVAAPQRRRLSPLRFVMPGIVLFWLAMAFIGPAVAPYGGAAIQDADLFEGMSRKFLLGTDYLGRDMLSRILEGARFTVAFRSRPRRSPWERGSCWRSQPLPSAGSWIRR